MCTTNVSAKLKSDNVKEASDISHTCSLSSTSTSNPLRVPTARIFAFFPADSSTAKSGFSGSQAASHSSYDKSRYIFALLSAE